MMNFEINQLYLVNPVDRDDACYARAVHAQPLLDQACVFSTFSEAVKSLDYLVATSSIESFSDKKHLRNSVHLNDFADQIMSVDGTVGLVFGREDYGLYNEEIAACDIMLRIPTSEQYLSLNLSHAVALVLYNLYVKQIHTPRTQRKIGSMEKGKLHEYFAQLLDEINYPEHKKEKTKIMFKRILGRSMPSTWEYHTLMGVFSTTLKKIRYKEKKTKGKKP